MHVGATSAQHILAILSRAVSLTFSPGIRQRSVVKMDTLVDIITLDNLEQKMPRWDPSSPSHLYALVDMGR
jgi:hypothetical protein